MGGNYGVPGITGDQLLDLRRVICSSQPFAVGAESERSSPILHCLNLISSDKGGQVNDILFPESGLPPIKTEGRRCSVQIPFHCIRCQIHYLNFATIAALIDDACPSAVRAESVCLEVIAFQKFARSQTPRANGFVTF